MASLVRVVRTSSPYSPSGTVSPVSGLTISGRKWSSNTFRAPRSSGASMATPGPMTSDKP